MQLEQRITEIIEPTVNDLGFEVVRVLLSGKHNPRLQIMAEPLARDTMTVDDCATISRAVSAVLDVEDPIPNAYTLEVSSPGLDRPLVKLRDFERFQGFDARVEMADAVDGRKRFKGRLEGVREDMIILNVDGKEWALPYAGLHRAKLLVDEDFTNVSQGQEIQ